MTERDCAACREYAADLADQFHPLSDVGPWDTACPACGHICCGLEGSVGACDEDQNNPATVEASILG